MRMLNMILFNYSKDYSVWLDPLSEVRNDGHSGFVYKHSSAIYRTRSTFVKGHFSNDKPNHSRNSKFFKDIL